MIYYKIDAYKRTNPNIKRILTIDEAIQKYDDKRLEQYRRTVETVLQKTGINIDVYLDDKSRGSNPLGSLVYGNDPLSSKFRIYHRTKLEPFIVIYISRLEMVDSYMIITNIQKVLMHELVHYKERTQIGYTEHNKHLPSELGDNNIEALEDTLNIRG